MTQMSQLALLTYNVHGRRDDQAALVRVIQEAGASLVVLQESPRLWFPAARAQRFARRCGMRIIAGGALDARGNVIMAREDEVHLTRSWVLAYPPQRGHHLRAAAVAECTVEGCSVLVAGTHLSKDPAVRRRQMSMLLTELKVGQRQSNNEIPVIIAGDINEAPGGPVWTDVTSDLVDAAGSDRTVTFSCRRPRRRIDGIFADRRLRVHEYRVTQSPLALIASDHFPVYASLELDPPATA